MADYGAFSSVPFCHFLEPDVDMGSHYSSKHSRTSPRRLYNPLDMRRTTKDLRSKNNNSIKNNTLIYRPVINLVFFLISFSPFLSFLLFNRPRPSNDLWKESCLLLRREERVLSMFFLLRKFFDNRRLGGKTLANIIKEKIM